MPATIALAHAGGTTGEWADALREVFGEYRAPTGRRAAGSATAAAELADRAGAARGRWRERTGGPPRLLVAKPGLDGHSNGAEQIAVAARDAGFEVVYQGIRLTPAQIAAAARDEDVDVVGLSILSGSHLELVPEVLDRLRSAGVDAPVVVGGIIPPEDAEVLRGKGVAAVYTPKDFELGRIVDELVDAGRGAPASGSRRRRQMTGRLRPRRSVTGSRPRTRRTAAGSVPPPTAEAPHRARDHGGPRRGAGRGHASCTAATMAASTAGSGWGAHRHDHGRRRRRRLAHSGTFPCLRFGRSSRLEASRRRLRTRTRRVSAGSMTSST